MIISYLLTLMVLIFIFNSYYNKNIYLLQYTSIIYLLALAPSTNFFGLYESSFYNFQFVRYVTLAMLPFSLYFYINNKTICKYASKIIIAILALISIVLIATYMRDGEIQRTYLLNVEIFLVVLLYSLYIFTNFPSKVQNIVKNFLLVVTIYAAILSLGTYIHLEPFYTIQKLFYNTYIGVRSLETLFDFADINQRSYSIFSGANQFSLFASISIIFGFYLYRIRAMNHFEFILLFLSTIIILISSGSRTGMFFYIFSLFVIYIKLALHYKIAITPLIIIILLLVLNILPARITDTLSDIDQLMEAVQGQRIDFWIVAWNILSDNFSNILFGFSEQIYIDDEGSHFESGYLQLFGLGGVFSVCCFLYLLKLFYSLYLPTREKILKNIILIFFLAEIFMGTFFELKWSIINGILLAYIIYISYIEYNIKKEIK